MCKWSIKFIVNNKKDEHIFSSVVKARDSEKAIKELKDYWKRISDTPIEIKSIGSIMEDNKND